jgi:DNA repair protein RAD7
MAADPPPGFLCHTCAKASGADPFKKPGAPRGRKPAAEKRKIVNYEQKDVFKSLAATCVEVRRFDAISVTISNELHSRS